MAFPPAPSPILFWLTGVPPGFAARRDRREGERLSTGHLWVYISMEVFNPVADFDVGRLKESARCIQT